MNIVLKQGLCDVAASKVPGQNRTDPRFGVDYDDYVRRTDPALKQVRNGCQVWRLAVMDVDPCPFWALAGRPIAVNVRSIRSGTVTGLS